ncbi:hypothetical protein KRMM14A1004_60290 [Krasilnikovia sp. MM14-A1004]
MDQQVVGAEDGVDVVDQMPQLGGGASGGVRRRDLIPAQHRVPRLDQGDTDHQQARAEGRAEKRQPLPYIPAGAQTHPFRQRPYPPLRGGVPAAR